MFPLPLTPWESLLLSADRPDYPMQFWLRVRFRGVVDQVAWTDAVRTAQRRHPLLAARLRTRTDGRWEWIAGHDTEPPLHWRESSATDEFPPLDITRQPGLWIGMIGDAETTEVLLQVHHVCCDALGALQFLADVRELYRARLLGRAPDLRPLDERRLLRRGDFGLSDWGWAGRWPQDSLGLLGLYEYWFHRTPALGTSQTQREIAVRSESASPNNPTIMFTEQDTHRLRERARASRATLNDLLVTALFEVLDAALREADSPQAGDALRITMATNLRRPEDTATPAANIVSVVFLDRRPGRFRTPQILLRSVHREMWLCKWWNAGITLIRLASWRQWLMRGRLPPPRDDRCLSTAVLSNLGDPWDQLGWTTDPDGKDPLLLTDIEFSPPTMPLTAAALGVVTCAGRLTVSLNHDRLRFSDSEAEGLLHRFQQRMLEWIDLPA